MEKNKRLFLSMSEEDVDKLDRLREELRMNRSQYIRYLLSGQKKVMPTAIKDKKLIDAISKIDLDMRVLALKEGVSPGDALAIYCEIREIKELLGYKTTSGPVDQKLGGK
ncbi:MAG: ribbon-helix-helix protein, CopG family [Lachnospiraceae bacterium]|nr:ribbon-helix-helix protein, CopG family [Lachnospiraceae bacterium]